MVKLRNEVEFGETIDSGIRTERAVTIKEQIQATQEQIKRNWWDQCCRDCCYYDERLATIPAVHMGRRQVQMTCPNCQCLIRTRRVYQKPQLQAGFLFCCLSPFISRCCKSVVHYCPACSVALGQSRRPPVDRRPKSFDTNIV